jgi:GH25 family lysozyme M1 (1,4-beta-N-acetylmuramidase)/5-hydroxyisourate hydrolase-like protein (transthyretin family)
LPTSSRPALRRLATTLVTAVTALATVTGTAVAALAATGIDVSSHQHSTTLSWTAVEADGISFAFVKATEGRTYTNPYFASDWAAARRHGIYRGAYHFAWPRAGTAVRQARFFVATAGLADQPGDLPPVLDLERTGGLGVGALRTWTRTWLETVRDLTGRTPAIYVSPYFWRTHLGNSRAFAGYPLWVAHYGVKTPDVPGGWSRWTFWQTTSSGRVAGIAGRVDMNRFNGSRSALATLANDARVQPNDPTDPTGPTAPTSPREVVRQDTTAALHLSSDRAYEGQSVTLSGRLRTVTGAPVPRRTVELYRRPAGGTTWVQAGSPRTDRNGRFASVRVPAGSLSFKVVFPGGRFYTRSVSPVRSVAVRPRMTARVDLQAGRTNVARGATVRLYGHLATATGKPLTGRRVSVYKRARGRSGWTLVRTVPTLGPTGWLQVNVRPMRNLDYRAVFAGTVRYDRATSGAVAVSVR